MHEEAAMDIPRAAEEGYSEEEAEEMEDAGKRRDQVYCCIVIYVILDSNGITASSISFAEALLLATAAIAAVAAATAAMTHTRHSQV